MGLYVKSEGEGPPLVLLHGWGLNHGVWLNLLPQLKTHFRLHLVDLPGHGHSPNPAEYTLNAVLENIRSHFNHGCNVLAWSMGALIAQAWAAQFDEIQRMVLVAGTPQFYQTPDWPHAMHANVLDDFATNLHNDYQGTLMRFLNLQSLGTHKNREQIRQLRRIVLDLGEPSKEALEGGLQILKSTNLRPVLDQIACPVLLIQGEKDILVPAETGVQLSRSLRHSRYVIIKQASHAPFLSHPQLFVRELLAFFAEKA